MIAFIMLLIFFLCILTRDPNSPFSLVCAAVLWGLLGVLAISRPQDRCYDQNFKSGAEIIITAIPWIYLLAMASSAMFTYSRFHSSAELATAGLAPVMVLLAFTKISQQPSAIASRIPLVLCVSISSLSVYVTFEMLLTKARPMGPFLDFNVPGALFNAGILPLIALLCAKRTNWLYWILLAVISVGQSVTVSRGADLALIVGLLIIAAACYCLKGSMIRLAYSVAIIILCHAAILLLPFSLRESGTLDLLQNPKSVANSEPSAAGRMEVWKSAFKAYTHESPWIGTGLGTYILVYPRYRSENELQTSGERAHSDYLERLLEGGPFLCLSTLGFGLFLPLTCLMALAQAYQRNQLSKEDILIRCGSLAACVALGTHAFVNFILAVPVLGFLFAFHIASGRLSEQPEQLGPYQSIGLKLAGFFALLIIVPTLLLMSAGQWLMGPQGLAFRDRQPERWLHLATVGATLQSFNPRFREALAESDLLALHSSVNPVSRKLLEDAIKREIVEWLDSNKCDTHAWESLAHFADESPVAAGTTALAAYQSALICQPQSLVLRANIAARLESTGDVSKAYSVLWGGIPWVAIAPLNNGFRRWAEAGYRLAHTLNLDEDFPRWIAASDHLKQSSAPSPP